MVRRNFVVPFSLAVLAIVSAEWWIVHSLYFQRNPDAIAIGATFDLVVVIPALYYFLVLRPKRSSLLFMIPCFALCAVVARWIIPAANQEYLHSLKRLSPALEVFVIAAIAMRLRSFIREYRIARAGALYFTDALFAGFQKSLSDRIIFSIAFVEFFLIYFSIGGWFMKPPHVAEGQQHFTYHKKSGYLGILGILLFVLLMETFALHMIVMRWSVSIAWILTVLSLYGAFWLIGDYHAIRVHPVIATPDMLYLRIGLRWRADIQRNNIAAIDTGAPKNPKSRDYLRASILWPRATLVLKSPVELHGLFGRKRIVSRLGLSIDDVDSFSHLTVPE